MGRQIDIGRITSERQRLLECLDQGVSLKTDVDIVKNRPTIPNAVSEDEVGIFRSPNARKAVIADMDRIREFQEKGMGIRAGNDQRSSVNERCALAGREFRS